MHVPLRRREIAVTGKLLNGTRRCAPHGQVRAERVPQHVEPHVRKPRPPGRVLHQPLQHLSRERSSISETKHPRTFEMPVHAESLGQTLRERDPTRPAPLGGAHGHEPWGGVYWNTNRLPWPVGDPGFATGPASPSSRLRRAVLTWGRPDRGRSPSPSSPSSWNRPSQSRTRSQQVPSCRANLGNRLPGPRQKDHPCPPVQTSLHPLLTSDLAKVMLLLTGKSDRHGALLVACRYDPHCIRTLGLLH